MSEPTLRERIGRLETLMENHIHTHEKREQWLLRILGSLVIGVVLLALPGCFELLASVI